MGVRFFIFLIFLLTVFIFLFYLYFVIPYYLHIVLFVYLHLERFDPDRKKYYYVNQEKNLSRWAPPPLVPPSSPEMGLLHNLTVCIYGTLIKENLKNLNM
jgi:hypothetical protein